MLSSPLGADGRSRPAPSRDLEVSALPPRRFRVCKRTRAAHGEEEQARGCLPLKTLFPPTPWQSLSPGELSVSLHTFQGSSREGAPWSPRHGGRAADKMETPPDRSPQPCCGGWLEWCPAGFTTPCLPGLPREAAHLGSTPASWLPLVPATWSQQGSWGSAVGLFRVLALKCPRERPLDGERDGGERGREGEGERDTHRKRNKYTE